MAVRAQIDDGLRWELTLHGVRTLSDDLGAMGEWVGPRTGRNARSHGQKEDYVLRRVLVACSVAGALEYPVTVAAETDRPGRPDFVLSCPNGQSRGLEVTEAGCRGLSGVVDWD